MSYLFFIIPFSYSIIIFENFIWHLLIAIIIVEELLIIIGGYIMESDKIIEKLKTFTTSELCDGFGDGRYRTMDYHIKRQVTNKNIVGRAYPVDTPYGISGIIPNAILDAKEGDVIVVAGKGFCKGSFWGDHRSICAAKKGLAGVVIDGAFRDKEGCEEAGVPIFARCVVPGSAGKCQQGKLNVPIICGGAEVNPGDYIVADVNGVVVIRPDEVECVMKNAEKKIAAEKATIARMEETGEILPRVLKM